MGRVASSAKTTRARWAALALLVSALGCSESSAVQPRKRPDIVLVVVDTLRADLLVDHPPKVRLRSLDMLAEEGVAFRRAFAHAPMTLPSHASLFASRPPLETGILCNGEVVGEELPLLAPWLSQHGYGTHAVVSLATLTPLPRTSGLARGFDSFDVSFRFNAPASDVNARLAEALAQVGDEEPCFLFVHYSDPHEPYDAFEGERREAAIRMDGRELDRFEISIARQWERRLELSPGRHAFEIESDVPMLLRSIDARLAGERLEPTFEEGGLFDRGKRVRFSLETGRSADASVELFTWVSDAPWDDDVSRERYIGEIRHLDQHLAQLFDSLKEAGLWEDSIVVFTSDHGEGLGTRGVFGHVQNLHDELLRVPLLVKLPAWDGRRADLAERAERMVVLADVVPTLLDAAGLPPLPGQTGASLLSSESSLLVAETHRPEAARDQLCLRDDSFKMIYFPAEGRFEMFDLRADPSEVRDVFAARRPAREQWVGRLMALAERAQAVRDGAPPVDPEVARDLKALGY
jgi:arylsulfatase A-like enzyme